MPSSVISCSQVFMGVEPDKMSATIAVVDHRETILATGGWPRTSPATRRCAGTLVAWRDLSVGGRGQQRSRSSADPASASRRGVRGRRCRRSCRLRPLLLDTATSASPTPTTRMRPWPPGPTTCVSLPTTSTSKPSGSGGPPRRVRQVASPRRQPTATTPVRAYARGSGRGTSQPLRPMRSSLS